MIEMSELRLWQMHALTNPLDESPIPTPQHRRLVNMPNDVTLVMILAVDR